MGLEENKKLARMACDYVLLQQKIEGGNWDKYRGDPNSWELCLRRHGATLESCKAIKSQLDFCTYDEVRPKVNEIFSSRRPMSRNIRQVAKLVEVKRCGNCTELSSVAFAFLEKKTKKLDLVGLFRNDHAFVIVGRPSKSRISDPGTWGRDAVICDPWGQGFKQNPGYGVYPASEFQHKMAQVVGEIREISLIHRK